MFNNNNYEYELLNICIPLILLILDNINIVLRLIKFMKNIDHNKQNNELSKHRFPIRFKPIFNNVEYEDK